MSTRTDTRFPYTTLFRSVTGLAGRRDVAVDEVQRHRHADRLVLVHALEVQVHDQLLVRMALHVTQQHLLHLAVDVQVDDRGIEPFLLAGDPGLFLLELDALRFAAATVDDGRNLARTTQAAARTQIGRGTGRERGGRYV